VAAAPSPSNGFTWFTLWQRAFFSSLKKELRSFVVFLSIQELYSAYCVFGSLAVMLNNADKKS